MKNQRLRMKGEEYIGFSQDQNKIIAQNVSRVSRQIGEILQECVSILEKDLIVLSTLSTKSEEKSSKISGKT